VVVQTLSQGADRRKAEIISILAEQLSPAGILERNDPKVRLLEGLPQSVSVLHGQVPEAVDAHMNGIHFRFDLRRGQKTGAFLDQRENYRAAAQYARGEVLDCFTYHGGFALHAARQAERIEAIDSSGDALASARENARRNGVANVVFREANVFDALKEYEAAGRRFDMVVLDPPAFAKARDALEAARRGYKEINLRALKLLKPSGLLVTCSCSHHLPESDFAEVLWESARDVRSWLQVVERRTQARDHPVLLSMGETYYLKCFIINRL
jgi:23S rRNA (cytosine1962-C5)-methyltransferase